MSRIIPHCIGTYEAHEAVCNGDENDPDPCVWRDRCAAVQAHLTEIGQDPEHLVTFKVKKAKAGEPEQQYAAGKHGFNRFVILCDEQAKRFGVKDGAPTKQPDKPKKSKKDSRKGMKPSKKAQKRAAEALTKRALDRRRQLRVMFDDFKQLLIGAIKDRTFAAPREAVAPGRLYVVDHIDKSGYASIYCKTPVGRDVPIVSVRFKPRNLTMDLEVPVAPDDFNGIGKETMKKLLPRLINDGLFRSLMPGLDREAVALAAEAIGTLVNGGRIKLPGRE